MTNEIMWDTVPTARAPRREQFMSGVVTMASLQKVGAGRKFTFNKASQELLGVVGEDRVSFGFAPDGCHVYVKKVTGTAGFQLTKTCSFSDKKTFEFIAKRLELNTEVENHFDVISSDLGDNVFELVLRTPMTEMVEGFADAREVVEFKSMDLGNISDEASHTPYGERNEEEAVDISSIADMETEDTDETADLTEQMDASYEPPAMNASDEEGDDWG